MLLMCTLRITRVRENSSLTLVIFKVELEKNYIQFFLDTSSSAMYNVLSRTFLVTSKTPMFCPDFTKRVTTHVMSQSCCSNVTSCSHNTEGDDLQCNFLSTYR